MIIKANNNNDDDGDATLEMEDGVTSRLTFGRTLSVGAQFCSIRDSGRRLSMAVIDVRAGCCVGMAPMGWTHNPMFD